MHVPGRSPRGYAPAVVKRALLEPKPTFDGDAELSARPVFASRLLLLMAGAEEECCALAAADLRGPCLCFCCCRPLLCCGTAVLPGLGPCGIRVDIATLLSIFRSLLALLWGMFG